MAALTAAILKVMADPAVKAKYDEAGLHPATMPRAEYLAFLQRDFEDLGRRRRQGQHQDRRS